MWKDGNLWKLHPPAITIIEYHRMILWMFLFLEPFSFRGMMYPMHTNFVESFCPKTTTGERMWKDGNLWKLHPPAITIIEYHRMILWMFLFLEPFSFRGMMYPMHTHFVESFCPKTTTGERMELYGNFTHQQLLSITFNYYHRNS